MRKRKSPRNYATIRGLLVTCQPDWGDGGRGMPGWLVLNMGNAEALATGIRLQGERAARCPSGS